jgi:hypothetical protein
MYVASQRFEADQAISFSDLKGDQLWQLNLDD